jgi:prefoldin subunit 5
MEEFLKKLDELLNQQREYFEDAEAFQTRATDLRAKAHKLQMQINGVRNAIKDELEKKG